VFGGGAIRGLGVGEVTDVVRGAPRGSTTRSRSRRDFPPRVEGSSNRSTRKRRGPPRSAIRAATRSCPVLGQADLCAADGWSGCPATGTRLGPVMACAGHMLAVRLSRPGHWPYAASRRGRRRLHAPGVAPCSRVTRRMFDDQLADVVVLQPDASSEHRHLRPQQPECGQASRIPSPR
jgi:hypothetical protein